jgi:hypothetical protein
MKQQKDTKTLLFENMTKINPDFILNEDKKWIQKAVDPEHKGYCTPMSKSTCTPRRKALAKRFKKGIDEENTIDVSDRNYEQKALKLKYLVDELLKNHEYDILDTWYSLMIKRKARNGVPTMSENYTSDYQKKAELIKGKIDFLLDTNHFDIIDQVDKVINKLFPDNEADLELTEVKTQQNDNYFDTLSQALDAVRERVVKKGYVVDENAMFTSFGTGGINYGETKRANIPLLKNNIPQKNRSVTIAIYRMDSGSYELTAYMN